MVGKVRLDLKVITHFIAEGWTFQDVGSEDFHLILVTSGQNRYEHIKPRSNIRACKIVTERAAIAQRCTN